MLTGLRTALVWLLMLAIPTQGIAAATMLYCGPGHQHMMGPDAASPSGHADAVAHEHAVPHDTHQHGASMAQNEESPGAPEQLSAAGALEQSSIVKCSVCALCCSAAAIVSSPLVVPPLDMSFAPNLSVPESPVSFLTGGPQRPPRSFLA